MNKRGFIALTLVFSIAGTLLGLVLANSFSTGLFFDQAMHKEYRTMNYYYAYDCLDQAILALAHDYFFTVDQPIEIPEYHCTILSMEKTLGIRIIKARGNLMNAYVYREATVRLNDAGIEIINISS